jgi:hypothetical protein
VGFSYLCAYLVLSVLQVVMYLVDLVQDPCVAVSRVASSCLDVIIDLNDDMAGESGFAHD